MKVIEKSIAELTPYENNPRLNDDAVDGVAESIDRFGFKVPMVIDTDGVIVCGHTRYKAAKKLGLKKVPCIIADDLTEDEIKAFRLADNKVAEKAKWDEELLEIELRGLEEIGQGMEVFGFEIDTSAFEAEEDGFIFEETQDDKPTKSKQGQIYKLGNHRLMCGDSTNADDVKTLVGGAEIDLLLTDPPYNVDYGAKAEAINKYGYAFSDKHIENDNMETDEFKAFLSSAFECAADAMRAGGAFYVWHASSTVSEFIEALRENELEPKQQLIWNKSSFVLGRQDYQWKHEPCLYGWKEGAAHYFTSDRTQRTVYEDKTIDELTEDELRETLKEIYSTSDVLDVEKPTVSREHPTMKPIKLMAMLIINSTRRGENVLDLFGGSGSTLIACEQLERRCYMMEHDAKYVDVIIKRWEEYTGEKAELL